MHISDGVFRAPIWIGGYLIAGIITILSTRKMKSEDMPKAAVMTSAFFITSLIHIPLGPASVHLVLNGLVGIILGPLSFVSILVGLLLQAVLFGHGGITAIGINSIIIGVPALLCYKVFDLNKRFNFRKKEVVFGAVAGALGPFVATIIMVLLLVSTGTAFVGVAKYAALANLPVIIIEGIVTSFIILFLLKVKPEILRRV